LPDAVLNITAPSRLQRTICGLRTVPQVEQKFQQTQLFPPTSVSLSG
jgi:hypothetical protein